MQGYTDHFKDFNFTTVNFVAEEFGFISILAGRLWKYISPLSNMVAVIHSVIHYRNIVNLAESVYVLLPPFCLRPHGLQLARLLCPWDFSRQEYWSGLPFPPPGDLPDPGIKPLFPALEGRFFTTAPPGKLVNLVDGDKDSLLDQLYLDSSEFFFNQALTFVFISVLFNLSKNPMN